MQKSAGTECLSYFLLPLITFTLFVCLLQLLTIFDISLNATLLKPLHIWNLRIWSACPYSAVKRTRQQHFKRASFLYRRVSLEIENPLPPPWGPTPFDGTPGETLNSGQRFSSHLLKLFNFKIDNGPLLSWSWIRHAELNKPWERNLVLRFAEYLFKSTPTLERESYLNSNQVETFAINPHEKFT